MEELWSAALPLLRQQVGERNFVTWIEPIRCTSDREGVCLEVPNRFFQEWITRHFLATIRNTLAAVAGDARAVRAVVSSTWAAPVPPALPPLPARRERATTAARVPKIGQLVAHYTFKTFVVGDANQVAYQAAVSVAEQPGRRFNPLFLHGGVGLGKTHLANALAHEMLVHNPRQRLACLSAESFMNSLITSLRQDQMAQFRDRFRHVDALILDDVQFLAGKERTQEEFFHTFNTLYGNGKQIVLTSDKPPAAIAGLEQRLKSRFEGGLIADVHPPTLAMRVAILQQKAAALFCALPDEVAWVLARTGGPSVRELEGALNRLIATATLRGLPISAELAQQASRPFAERPTPASIEAVQEAVGQHFNVSLADLKSHRRERSLAHARQVAMYLCRVVADASFPAIAEKFGGRDHSTVMHAVRVVEQRRAADPALGDAILMLESALRNRAAA
ncbi:MAG: chromosomal replication initiator protein DnaA [Deltaproteobacteria bacterium]|nr:chromosomal replication initiator protein DnaA [Deltaproteobacteria bacterium]MBI3389036.1 chromosomal replication initiator protein DnaA [Deltaproteobacteria bacterium]